MFVRLSIAGRQGESLREAGGPSEGAASTPRGGLTHLLKWHPLRHSYFLFRAKTRHGEAEPSVLRRTLGPRPDSCTDNRNARWLGRPFGASSCDAPSARVDSCGRRPDRQTAKFPMPSWNIVLRPEQDAFFITAQDQNPRTIVAEISQVAHVTRQPAWETAPGRGSSPVPSGSGIEL
ncbi:hypothetical protein O3P69_008086 [Scylla paramamosain]|uniref:Uncharacterized protein n=1 Tax=Scylla paramamosain TaxID=85552 RepID=A0AAW0T1N1_SCYPA